VFSQFSIEAENEPDCIIYSDTSPTQVISLINSFPNAKIIEAKCASHISKVKLIFRLNMRFLSSGSMMKVITNTAQRFQSLNWNSLSSIERKFCHKTKLQQLNTERHNNAKNKPQLTECNRNYLSHRYSFI